MDLKLVESVGICAIKKHGLKREGWRIQFDNAKRRFGCCNYRDKSISLSKELCLLNGFDNVNNTILHEIAHALVGRGHGHNSVFYRKCLEIGAKPKRCFGDEVKRSKPNHIYECLGCGMKFNRIRRLRNYKACKCGKCHSNIKKVK